MIKKIVALPLILLCLNVLAQNKVDSLKSLLSSSIQDTGQVNILIKLNEHLIQTDPKEAISYSKQALQLAKKIGYKNGMAKACNEIGVASLYLGDYAGSENFLNKSLKIQQQLNNPKELAETTGNIGYIYYTKGSLDTALIYFKRAANINKKAGMIEAAGASLSNIGAMYQMMGNVDSALVYYSASLNYLTPLEKGTTLSNISLIYEVRGDIKKALEYKFKALHLKEQEKDNIGIVDVLINIGMSYNKIKEYQSAIDYFEKGVVLSKKIKNKVGLAKLYNELGCVYAEIGQDKRGLAYCNDAKDIAEGLNLNDEYVTSLFYIGNIYYENKDFQKAIELNIIAAKINRTDKRLTSLVHNLECIGKSQLRLGDYKKGHTSLLEAYELSKKIEHYSEVLIFNLKESYKHRKEYEKALEMHELYVSIRDSNNKEEGKKELYRQEAKYEFEKAQLIKENEAKEQARVLAEATGRRNNLQYSSIFLGILVLFVAILMLGFIKVSPNVAEGLIFFAFLILFEFALVFTEPYLEQYTNGEPMYNLLANSVLALLIFPVHALLEGLLKKRIVK